MLTSRLPSTLKHDFSRVPPISHPRSTFSRPKRHITTMDAGYLVPLYCERIIPGDTFKVDATIVARLTTPKVPYMDNAYIDFHFFFVPSRLLWDNWTKFMGERINPDDTNDYLLPQVTVGASPAATPATGSIYDYFGIPVGKNNLAFDALPFRAYYLIYNEWYRDENLQDSLVIPKDNGPDAITEYALQKRNKRHDYFTSCLPWPQKSDAVTLPLGTTAPIVSDGTTPRVSGGSVVDKNLVTHTTLGVSVAGSVATGGNITWTNSGLEADLTLATAATINAFREAFSLQEFYELDARGGTRYTEILLSHYGVHSSDARLQRPEFVGGGSININTQGVPSTVPAAPGDTPQGYLAAYGYATGTPAGFNRSFEEHGYIIGIASIRADLTYNQGLNRQWSYRTREDFYWPSFAHLGEQAVLNKELVFSGTPGTAVGQDDYVFGYQERYAEYRYAHSYSSGLMRSDPTTGTSVDIWHLGQEFASVPELADPEFIQENPPFERVLAIQAGEPQFLVDAFFSQNCARPMPLFGVPGLGRRL